MIHRWFPRLLVCLLLASCARKEGDRYVPESLPYSMQLFARTNPTVTEELDQSRCFLRMQVVHDSEVKRDLVQQFWWLPDSIQPENPVRATFTDGTLLSAMNQITFNRTKYPGIREVALQPGGVNLFGSSHPDPLFQRRYDDSLVYSSVDLDRDSLIWDFQRSFPMHRPWYMETLCLWRPRAGGNPYLVARKSCQISGGWMLDTMYVIDMKADTPAFRVPFAPKYRSAGGAYQQDSLLVFWSHDSHTPLSYQGFDTRHCYLVAYRLNGTIAWADTLTQTTRYNGIAGAVARPDYPRVVYGTYEIGQVHGHDSTRLFAIDRSSGQPLAQRAYPGCVVPVVIQRSRRGDTRYLACSTSGNLIVFDTLLHELESVLVSHKSLLYTSPPTFSSVGWERADRFPDIAEDVHVCTPDGQVLVLDGETFEPLVASPGSDHVLSFEFIRTGSGTPACVLYDDRAGTVYTIVPTPLFTRLGAYLDYIIAGLVLLVLLPFGYYAVRRIQYHRLLFRALTSQSAAQGVAVFTRGGRVKRINARARDFLGLGSDRRPGTIADFPAPVPEMLAAYVETGTEQSRQMVLGSGEQRFLAATVSGFRGFGGVTGVLLTVTDATEAVESELRRSMLALAMSIAHDANNPLAAIRSKFDGMLMRMRREGLADAPWLLDGERVVTESIDETSDVIRKLLYITNIAEGAFVDANLRAVVEEWIERSGRRYRRNGIRLVDDIPAELPLLHLEPKHIGLLLQCACDNAADAMLEDQHDGCVRFDAERTAGGGVRLIIADNGTGMDAATLALLERPYFTTKSGGSGLGLRIIRRVCAHHRAALSIASERGVGTSLHVTFMPSRD